MDPFGAAAAVITAYTAVRWLYDNGADPENAAEQKYRDFSAAIRGLVRAIQNIEEDFGNGWIDSDGTAGRDARLIKYDFAGLLEECEQLLARHAHLQYNRANVLQNITWNVNIQPIIDRLVARIAVQTQRATFIYTTLSHNRQSEMAAQLNHIMQALDPTASCALTLHPDQHIIHPDIVDSFCRATYRKPPQGYESPDKFRFRDGLNTLRSHLEQSTAQAGPGQPQTIHQHISLLKAQWLLQTIKNLDHFQNLRIGTRDRSEVQKLENIIVKELNRQDLTSFRLEELLSLPSNHFFIWETTPQNVLRDLMQPFGEEMEIVNTELPAPPNYQLCRLVVFRDLGHTQGTMVRLARQWKRDGQLLPPCSTSIDAFTHIFKPLYALATSADQHLSIELSNADGGQAEVYQFKELKDVFRLQWALSNYHVFSDFKDIEWTITRSAQKNINGKTSRIQIWWYDPQDELEDVAAEITSPRSRNSGRTSIYSTMTSTAGRAILQDSASQRTSCNSTHTTKQSKTEVVVAIPPYEPLLVIFAWRERRYEYLSVQLHGQMYIDQTKCRCKREEDKCNRSVIRSRNGVPCQVKRTSIVRGRPNDIPNLNIFARSHRKGVPQHPLMDSAESVHTRELTLDFAGVMQRRAFNQQFEFILKLQRSREETDAILLQRAVFLSEKPQGSGNVRDRITGSIEGSGPSGSSISSSRRGLSQSTSPTQSDPASGSDFWENFSIPPHSAISSNFSIPFELSSANYK